MAFDTTKKPLSICNAPFGLLVSSGPTPRPSRGCGQPQARFSALLPANQPMCFFLLWVVRLLLLVIAHLRLQDRGRSAGVLVLACPGRGDLGAPTPLSPPPPQTLFSRLTRRPPPPSRPATPGCRLHSRRVSLAACASPPAPQTRAHQETAAGGARRAGPMWPAPRPYLQQTAHAELPLQPR